MTADPIRETIPYDKSYGPTRAQIIATARTWLGTRWRHQACLKGVGCDCIGLIAGVALELGSPQAVAFMARTDYRNYGRQPDPKMLLAACTDFLDPVVVGAAQAGDVLLLRFQAEPQHFAFQSGADYMIHSWAGARRVVENRINELWRGRIVGAYSLRGTE
jgi:NlpC/P60 family putative phage cell wall peptidase